MKYIDCIELLDLVLSYLKEKQRVQVPISKLTEIQMIMTRVLARVNEYTDNELARANCEDLILAISVAQENKAVRYLNDQMKQSLVDGARSLRSRICCLAYDYYDIHEFEVTDANKPYFMEIVRAKFLEGGT